MRGLTRMQRAALLLAGAVLGTVVAGTVAAWLARARIDEVQPLPPAKGEPAPEPQAAAGPPPRGA